MIYGQDFKEGVRHRPAQPSFIDGRHHWIGKGALLLISLSVIGVVVAKTHGSITQDTTFKSEASVVVPSNQRITEKLSLPTNARLLRDATATQAASRDKKDTENWTIVKIQKGDSLSIIFSKLEIHGQLHPLLAIPAAQQAFSNLRPGQTLRVRKDKSGLAELFFDFSTTKRLHVTRLNNKLDAQIESAKIETRRMMARGTIESSLVGSGKKAGLSSSLVMKLVDIFAYDIDFAQDIREGDTFKVIFEEYYAKGEKLSVGTILAAEFTNRGRKYKALRFTDSKGRARYYTPEGKSLRKAFLRTPVESSHVSSHFNLRRKHPILNTIRAHKGVDYAAPKGTPIKAASDGKITFRGTQNGYGKTIILQHGRTYSTLYGHLSRYKKGQKIKQWVRQGEIIGYVGSTGRATGPHLHYEFRVNGTHKNPLTVKLPPASPIPQALRTAFEKQTRALIAQMTYENTLTSITPSE